MASLWPWLAVAGVGALHGLNPATGWIFAAAWGVRSGDRVQALRALLPIAVGHAASVALVAGAVVVGVSLDRALLQIAAVGLLVIVAIVHLSGRRSGPGREPTGQAGLALWSFLMSTTHGAGLMLVPALAPLCMGVASGRQTSASGSLALALAAVGVHTVSMLVVSGLIAAGVCRAFAPGAGVLRALRRLGLSLHAIARQWATLTDRDERFHQDLVTVPRLEVALFAPPPGRVALRGLACVPRVAPIR